MRGGFSDRSPPRSSGGYHSHSDFRNDRFDGPPRFQGMGGRDDRFGQNLNNINWDQERLEIFEKNFYVEHPEVASMTSEEAEKIRQDNNIVVFYKGVAPKPIRTFMEGGFPEYLLGAIKKAGFQKPSPIQIQGWPIALSGHDMIGIAETGSGKTCAFLLPGILHIMAQPELKPGDGPIMLVLAPTRELTVQIQQECDRFASSLNIKSTCVYGGAPRRNQERELSRGAEILVGCPGRLIDFLKSNVTNLKRVTYLVMDEADRMLDMGFEPQIRNIVSQIRPDRQTLMWSATWPREVERLARDLCKEDPIKINVGILDELKACENVTQHVEVLGSEHEKQRRVVQLLIGFERDLGRLAKTIVFVDRKREADDLGDVCRSEGLHCSILHGDKSQDQRDMAMHRFRQGVDNILIATDVASRGLDVKDITCVINKDFPKETASYIHRIGRTGRAGAKGSSYTLISPENYRSARDLIKILRDANQIVPRDLHDLANGTFRPQPASSSFNRSSEDRFGGGSSRADFRDQHHRGGQVSSRFADDNGSFSKPSFGGFDDNKRSFGGERGFGRREHSRSAERRGGPPGFSGSRSPPRAMDVRERSRERSPPRREHSPPQNSYGGGFGGGFGGMAPQPSQNRSRSNNRSVDGFAGASSRTRSTSNNRERSRSNRGGASSLTAPEVKSSGFGGGF